MSPPCTPAGRRAPGGRSARRRCPRRAARRRRTTIVSRTARQGASRARAPRRELLDAAHGLFDEPIDDGLWALGLLEDLALVIGARALFEDGGDSLDLLF